MQKLSQKTQGIVYVLIAAFGFSLMSMFIKLAGDLPSFEKAFFRNFVALIFITILMLRSRTSFRPERRNLPALFGRCFFGTLGLLCNFYAIGKLNLPDANMLNKLSPFFAILFSIFLLREKPNLVQVLGVLVAFGGSVCIIKPSFDNPQMLPALAGVLGGLGAGAAYTFVRYLGARGKRQPDRVLLLSVFVHRVRAVRGAGLCADEPAPARVSAAGGRVRVRRAARHHESLCLRAGQGNLGV